MLKKSNNFNKKIVNQSATEISLSDENNENYITDYLFYFTIFF